MYHQLLVVYYATLFCYLPQTLAQTVQVGVWNVPDGKLPDLSQTFTAGTILPLSWNSYNSSDYIDATKSLLYLWVTTFDYAVNPYSQLIKENINLTSAGNFAWTISIPDSSLEASAKYVLRFKDPSLTYDSNSSELSSPGFLVLRASASSTSASSSSSTIVSSTPSTVSSTAVISSAIPISSSLSSSGKVAADAECSNCGMTTGAKAGIGIGVTIAVLVLLGSGLFCMRKRRIEKVPMASNAYQTGNDSIWMDAKHSAPGYLVELPSRETWGHAELPDR